VRAGVAEEDELGAVTLEDTYVRLVGAEALANGKEAADGAAG
jgi:hypothetical protein